MRLTLSPMRAVLSVPVWAVLTCLSFFPAPAQSERPPEDFQIAIGLLQRGMHEEAGRYLQNFLRANSDHRLAGEAWYRLGTCQAETGKSEAAAGSFRKALQGRGDFRLEPECTYRLATTLVELGNRQEALQWLGRLVRSEGEEHYLFAAACYAAGECHRDMGADDKALNAFQAAAEAADGDQASFLFPALYQAAFCELRLGRPASAADLFDRAAEAADQDAAEVECRYLAGDAALRAGEIDRAEQAMEAVQESGGEFADDALLGLGFCAVRRGDTDAALERFRRLKRRHGSSPLVPQARLEIGRLLYQSASHEEARRELAAVLAVRDLPPSQRATALELDGLSALELDDPDTARAAFEAAKELAPSDPDRARLQQLVAEAHASAGDPEAALAGYRKVERSTAGPAVWGDALYGQCLALHRLDRFGESKQVAEQLLEELPDHRLAVLARFAVAENLFALQEFAEAEAAYRQLPDDHDLQPKAAFKGAWCAYLRGERQRAAQRFAAIAENEEHPFREEALSMQALALLETDRLDEALEAADRYRARHPEGEFLARTERVAARVLRSRGDLEGAAARLQRAAQVAGADEAAVDLLEQAEVLFERGDFESARGLYRRLAERDDRTGASALEGLAWCAFELGDDEACLEALNRGHRHPQVGDGRAALWELESALHHRNQDWEKAERVGGRFLDRYPDHPNAPSMRYSLGVAQARAGKLEEARATLAALAGLEGIPNRDRVHYELAWVLRKSGDEPGALAQFAEVAAHTEDVDLAGEARLHLGLAALEQGDADTARKVLQSVQGAHRGRALYRLGFYDLEHAGEDRDAIQRARESFEAVVQLGENQPLFLESTFLVGECWYRLAEPKRAAPSFRAVLQGDAEHDRAQLARLRLGECSVLNGDSDAAVVALTAFLDRADEGQRTDRARAHLWLGRARQARREYERAEESFQQVTALSEGELAAEAQYRIGESRLQRDDLQGAADAFVKLPILYGHDEWVRKGLLQAGLAYEKLEQPAKARRFYEELTNRFPDSAESREAASRLRGI